MSEFRFKQFTVFNDRSAMKVNTDGVMLGAAASLPKDSVTNILDIGTGTGTIALMLAQRTAEAFIDKTPKPVITAIDIDEASVEEAAANFARSPWADRLSVEKVALQDFDTSEEFALIVSNPPYFDDSLRNPDERKADARHTASLSFREILEFASRRLSSDGRVALVLPSEPEKELLRCARSYSLYPSRLMRIRTTEKKHPRRIIAEFSRERGELAEETLTIMQEGRYTAEYTALLKDFLIIL